MPYFCLFFTLQVSFLLYQALNALAFCHAQHIAHCDLKPSNIYVDRDCRLKLGDFGLSRFVSVVNSTASQQQQQEPQSSRSLSHDEPSLSVFGNSVLSTGVSGIESLAGEGGGEAKTAAVRPQPRMKSKSGGAGGPGPAAAPDAGGGGGGALSPHCTPLLADGVSTVASSSSSSLSSYLAPAAAADGFTRKRPRVEEADDTAGGGALASGGGGVAAAATPTATPAVLDAAAPADNIPTSAFLPPSGHTSSFTGGLSSISEGPSIMPPKEVDERVVSTQPVAPAPTAPHFAAHVLMAECAYRAPEVLWPANLDHVSTAQDLWALGCVFWELLAATVRPEKASSATGIIYGSSSSSGKSSNSHGNGNGGGNDGEDEEAFSASSTCEAVPPLPLDDQGRILGGYCALPPLFAPLEKPPLWIPQVAAAATAAAPKSRIAGSLANAGEISAVGSKAVAAPITVPSSVSGVASPLGGVAQPKSHVPVMIPRPGNRLSGAPLPRRTVLSEGKGKSSNSCSSSFDNGSQMEFSSSRATQPLRGNVCSSPGIPRRTSATNLHSGSPSLHSGGKGGIGRGSVGRSRISEVGGDRLTLASSTAGRPLSKDSQAALATFLTVLGPSAAAALTDEPSNEESLSAAATSFVVASAKHLNDTKPLFLGNGESGGRFQIEAEELLRSLLCFVPTRRPSALGALEHDFFQNRGAFDRFLKDADGGNNGNSANEKLVNGGDVVIRPETIANAACSDRNQGHVEHRSSESMSPSVALSQRSVRRELWAETNGPIEGPP